MNKIFSLSVIIFTLLFAGCANNNVNSAAKNFLELSVKDLGCDDIRNKADEVTASMNHCQSDSDCLIVDEYLFGCYYITNKNANQASIKKLMNAYHEKDCPQIMFDCFNNNPKLTCINSKCAEADR